MATILIVDDHVLNRQFLMALLGFDHHTVLSAADGQEALQLARSERPDLIITDILMPNMNGYEFTRQLRGEPAIAGIPVIFYTSTYSSREANAMARTCGVRWVLQKPSPPELILKTVHEALGLPYGAPQADIETPATARLAPIDAQLSAYLAELDASRQLMSDLAAGADATPAERQHLLQVSQQLSHSLADLQTVSLRLTALIDMGIELTVQRDPVRLLETGCKVARHISVAAYAVIGIASDDGASLRYLMSRGLDTEQRSLLTTLLPGMGVLGTLLGGRAALRRKDLDGDPQTLGLPGSHPPLHCFLGVPIASSGRCYGWIYVVDKLGADQFSEVDERAVATVATQLAVAYENLALYEKIQDNIAQLEGELIERQRISDQLHESEARFRQLAEHIDEVFFLDDTASGRTLYISPAYETVWGRSCASMYQNPGAWREAVHPDDLAALRASETAASADGRFDRRYRIVRPDGSLRWIHARGFPIRDAGGACYRIAGIAADITEQMRLQESLAEREAGLQRAQLVARMAHVIIGPDGSFESWSATLAQLIGVTPQDMPRCTRQWLAIVDPGDRERFLETCFTADHAPQRLDLEYRIRRGDGVTIQVQQVLEPLEGKAGADGRPRWFNTIQDISEQQAQQQRITRLSQIYAVLSGINSAIVRLRERGELLQEACRVAVSAGAFGMAWAGILDPDSGEGSVVACCGGAPGYTDTIHFSALPGAAGGDSPACVAVRERRQVICNDIGAEASLAALRKDLLGRGHRALAALPLIIDQRAVAVIVLFADEVGFFDQADRRTLLDELAGDLAFGLQFIAKEEQLHYLAYYDALTALPNGTLFNDRLTQFLHAADDAEVVAVIVLNLDHFVRLNDALGRHAGDAALKMLAQRLLAQLREPYSLARIGGDTFAVAIGGLHGGTAAATMLEQQILAPLHQPLKLGQQEVRLSVRAGIALYPSDGRDAETLFKHAEVALKKAKSSGERYLFYAPQMNAAVAARMELDHALRGALEAGQFLMLYQPRVDLLSGRIVSAEALIRWQHPQRGLVGPVEFIPLAEESGLIVPLGDWVIDAVCAQQAAWRAAGLRRVPVAVNLSALQFKRGGVQQSIAAALQRHGLAPRDLECELTESVVMAEPEQAIAQLQALKQLGLQLSLDDFGTGYSSLAYLKRFPFDVVKIDRAFISDLNSNTDDAAIATAVIAMAHSLGLRVVAEGVETDGQLQFLRRHRCDELQGYHFSPPIPAAAFAAMLSANKRLSLTPETRQREDVLLVVDDDPTTLSALRRLFRQDGYRLLTAGSGEEGLELLALNPVQVILSGKAATGLPEGGFLDAASSRYPDAICIVLPGAADEAAGPRDDAALRAQVRAAFWRCRPPA